MRFAVCALALVGCATGRSGALGPETVLDEVDMVWSVALSPDAARAAVVRLDARGFRLSCFLLARPDAALWDVPVTSSDHDVEAVEFSPDGARLATAGQDGAVRVFDVRDGRLLGAHTLEAPQRALAWSPQGDRLASGGDDGVLSLSSATDFAAAPVRVPAHSAPVRAVVWRPEALFTGGWDKAVRKWGGGNEAQPLVPLGAFAYPFYVNDLTADANGKVLGVAFSTSPAERTPEVHARERRGEREPAREGNCAARVDAQTGQVLSCPPSHHGVVATAAISPDGTRVASGGWDHAVALGPSTRTFGWAVRRVRFSSDGRRLAVAAWTPPNPVGSRKSAPSAMVIEVAPP